MAASRKAQQRARKIKIIGVIFLALLLAGMLAFFLAPQERSVDVTTYVVARLEDCALNQSHAAACYRTAATDFMDRYPLKDILAVLKENENRSEVFSRCHEVTHYLSRREYERVRSVPKVYAICNEACHGGCYHGVIEAYFKEQNLPLYGTDQSRMAKAMRRACGTREDYGVFRLFKECMHGIGHAMMFITDGELPHSLKLCDALEGEEEEETCYGGVFMEGSSSSTNRDHPGKYIRSDDPLYPCNILEEKYLEICYSYQSSYFSILTNYNWSWTIELCLEVPQAYQDGCFRFVGSNQVGYTQDMALMKNNCGLIPDPAYRDVCITGVVDSLVGRYADSEKALRFCSLVERENKPTCYRAMIHELSVWGLQEDELRGLCLQVPEEYGDACLQAIANRPAA